MTTRPASQPFSPSRSRRSGTSGCTLIVVLGVLILAGGYVVYLKSRTLRRDVPTGDAKPAAEVAAERDDLRSSLGMFDAALQATEASGAWPLEFRGESFPDRDAADRWRTGIQERLEAIEATPEPASTPDR
ncbi:MAG: hypothetical protein AAF517_12110 [Planctomycetota bacterium]